jgi:hypothetical protein
MSTFGIVFGGWLTLNAVFGAAMLIRLPNRSLRQRLFRWVIGAPHLHRQGVSRALIVAHRQHR